MKGLQGPPGEALDGRMSRGALSFAGKVGKKKKKEKQASFVLLLTEQLVSLDKPHLSKASSSNGYRP